MSTSLLITAWCDGLQVARGYEAVVMDFGSARRMPRHISNRTEALGLQEEAEVCSQAMSHPELWVWWLIAAAAAGDCMSLSCFELCIMLRACNSHRKPAAATCCLLYCAN